MCFSDVESKVTSLSGYCCSRASFSAPNRANIQRLILRINYDDAFIAYLNGEEIAQFEREHPEEYKQKLEAAYKRMYDAGADYVVDSIADVVEVVDDITSKN